MEQSNPPNRPKRAMIVHPIPCPRCGYTLMGLPIDRSCPECGLSIGEALDQIVDPTASALPQLRNPGRTGAALFGLTVLQLFAMLAMCVYPVLERLAIWRDSPPPPAEMVWTPLAAAALALLALGGIWQLSLPHGQEADGRVARFLRLMAIGAIGFAGTVIARTIMQHTVLIYEPLALENSTVLLLMLADIAMVLTAGIHFHGFGQIVRIIGQRSREYRTSNIGRQRIRDLIVVIAVFGGAAVAYEVGLITHQERIIGLAVLIAWISVLMLLIGQAYLVVNAWWIRRAIGRSIPHLRDLIQMVATDNGGRAANS